MVQFERHNSIHHRQTTGIDARWRRGREFLLTYFSVGDIVRTLLSLSIRNELRRTLIKILLELDWTCLFSYGVTKRFWKNTLFSLYFRDSLLVPYGPRELEDRPDPFSGRKVLKTPRPAFTFTVSLLSLLVVFTAQRSYASVLGSRKSVTVCPSVRLSVCHRRALWQSQTMYCGYFYTKRKGNHSSFLTPAVFGGRPSFVWNLCWKWLIPSKNADFERFSAYNISTVRYSEKVQLWWIGSQPCAFQRAVVGVRMLALIPQ